ncbi:hypothetical protein VTK26DRAFT_867 [Humicola hyalothermophila]
MPRYRFRYNLRPAVAAVLLVALITAYSLVEPATGGIADRRRQVRSVSGLGPRNVGTTDAACRAVHDAIDQCAFVLANCEDEEAGLIHYLTFYYCTLGGAKSVAFAILAAWLGLLFTTIGIAASDFFSVNLSTIASVLGLSESLAGVTFLAFGNGSPDVFSTFAAMGSNSGSMAVGELIGAAGFITAVVAGSMALVREFKVNKRTFVRDIVFFITAISFALAFLADGELHLWECFAMIGFYLFYVTVVVGWHWFTSRRRRLRMRDAASRTHFHGTSGHGTEELEPYRDDPDEDEAAPVGGRSGSAAEPADISALEIGPRIEVDRVGVPYPISEEGEEDRDIHVAAEMASSMRVNRPRWGRSSTTITPIRPSLVGVLEFRSVLSSLQKERNMHLSPLHARSQSIRHQRTRSSADDSRGRPRNKTLPAHVPSAGARERALSHGNPPLNLENAGLPQPGVDRPSETRTSSAARTIDGRLAPPNQNILPSQLLHIRIPSPSGPSSGHSSPSLSPFPGLSESPAVLSPFQEPTTRPFSSSLDDAARRHTIPGIEDDSAVRPRPVRWWPYQILPPPHVLLATLFPTLQGWREKTLWDKLVSLISVPSIFFLVVTLPVAEAENGDEQDDDDMSDIPALVEPPSPAAHTTAAGNAPSLSVVDGAGAAMQPETEWQAYRRRTRSVGSRVSPLALSPSQVSLANMPAAAAAGGERQEFQPPRYTDDETPGNSISMPVPQTSPAAKLTASGPGSDHLTASLSEPPSGWNRWLAAVQLFTGPLFVVFISWANTAEDWEEPKKTLLRMILFSLLVSLCLLAGLVLTTTPDKKPKYHFLLCFLGFVISVAWISTIAGEVVGVLKAFGVILNISEAILGLTVFAVGNSLGDLVADVTVARLGYPVMALAACFGGPMLNILLGVGIGGAWMGISSAKQHHHKHPDMPLHYKPYRIQVGGTLMISAVTVLLTLIVLLIVVPSNNWVMSRKIGWGLIGIWTVGTIVNLVMEMTGTWSDVS